MAVLVRFFGFLLLLMPLAATGQTPFTNPIALPGTFEAENFDNGGEGVAYHDKVAGNAGGAYRTTDVDIIVTRDAAGGGYSVNNFQTGEWLAYTVNIAAAGQYEIAIRAANGGATPTQFSVHIDNFNVTGSVSVPPTGGWSNYQWVAKTGVSLPAGQHVLKIFSEQEYFDLNQIRVTSTPTTPFAGVVNLPGTLEAENFDNGGQGLAYHDNTAGNQGNAYRTNERVDIKATTDAGGGHVVFNFETGEWLLYSVNIASTGFYDIDVRLASGATSSAKFHVEIDGTNVTGPVNVPATGDFDTFQWVGAKGVPLTAGAHVLKLVADQQYFDVNQIRVTQATHSPYTGTPISLPGTFEAENFDLGGEGSAYHDIVPGNAGGPAAYRPGEDVDTRVSQDSLGGGHVIYNFQTGEWLVYTVDVAQSGSYDIELRVASGTSTNTAFHVEIDGVNVTQKVTVPPTGSFSTFQWVGKKGVQLSAGQHVLKVVSEQEYFDLNSIRIVPATTPAAFSCSFENGSAACGFTEERTSSAGSAIPETTFTRDGTPAVRLRTVVEGPASNSSFERNDLRLPESTSFCQPGQEEWWAHSVYFPDEYAVPPSSGGHWYVVMDFHHVNPPGTGHTKGQANVNLDAGPTGLRLRLYGGAIEDANPKTIPIGPVEKNKWYDFVYHVKWTSENNGLFEAWVNGKKVWSEVRPTLYAGKTCTLKLANYHSRFGKASHVIHDRVKRGPTADSVWLAPIEGF